MSRRLHTVITLGALLIAGPPPFAAETAAALDGRSAVTLAGGVDSNVFLSRDNRRSSTFLQATFKASVETDPALAQRLSFATRGWYRHYFRFGEADKIFADAIFGYRYAPSRAVLLGVLHTASYTQLQLLDTEGNTLPRDQFAAYGNEVRGYLQTLPTPRTRVTLGGGVRTKDVQETADTSTVSFPSLDHRGYFTGVETGYRQGSKAADLGYEYGVTHYDETQANNRDTSSTGIKLATNPLLTLIQHTVRSRLGWPLAGWLVGSAEIQLRWNLDPFENDLTYRQSDGSTQWDVLFGRVARWSNSVAYRTRLYAERTGDLGAADREERFLTFTTSLQRRWTRHLASTLQYQVNRKTSNLSDDQFTLHTYSVGLEAIF